ncbi:hypothetical protein B566_EDAN005964 [Ephemera danica]|nr:hypothetical protein B566_EDAN005964 [Ephemera danica]
MATALQASQNGMKHLVNGASNHVTVKEEACVPANGNGTVETSEEAAQDVPEVDIEISNVVCSFSVRCHLNLREIALNGSNVEYKREQGMVTMKLRRPYTTASIWSSGKVTVTGATTEDCAHLAARRIARSLQQIGFNARFSNYRVVNVLGSCTMPFNIKIAPFSERHRTVASYEPELHPGVTYRIKEPPKATLKIFSTGSITVTGAPSVAAVQAAVEHIYPLVQEFRSIRTAEQIERMKHRAELKRNRLMRGGGRAPKKPRAKAVTHSDSEEDEINEPSDDELEIDETEPSGNEDSFDSCD